MKHKEIKVSKLKGNEIVEIREYLLDQLKDLTLQEWRLLGYYLAKIDPRDITTRYVRIDLEDYLALADIGEDANIPYLKENTRKLISKVINGCDPDKHVIYSQCPLFQRCRLMEDERGHYYFELNASDDALPLMFDFQKHYIKAKGMNIFALNSPKQILMYFFLRQQFNLGIKNVEISVDEFKEKLGIKKNEYQNFYELTRTVIKSCEDAINKNSDLCFSFEKGRCGAHGRCETIKIHIKENKKIAKQLEPEQLPDNADNKIIEITKKITELCIKCTNKKLNPVELDWIKSWVEDYSMTEDLVKLAIKDNSFRTYLTMKNIDDTITKWHKNGIKTVEDAEIFCKREYEKNKAKAKRKASGIVTFRTGEESGFFDSAINQPEKSQDKSISETSNGVKEIPRDILDMFENEDEEPDI